MRRPLSRQAFSIRFTDKAPGGSATLTESVQGPKPVSAMIGLQRQSCAQCQCIGQVAVRRAVIGTPTAGLGEAESLIKIAGRMIVFRHLEEDRESAFGGSLGQRGAQQGARQPVATRGGKRANR